MENGIWKIRKAKATEKMAGGRAERSRATARGPGKLKRGARGPAAKSGRRKRLPYRIRIRRAPPRGMRWEGRFTCGED